MQARFSGNFKQLQEILILQIENIKKDLKQVSC
jgi:hypothetical protein